MSLFPDVKTFVFLLPLLIHFTCCAPIAKRNGESPCLVDSDCLVAHRCYWSPQVVEPTGRCRFAFPQNPIRSVGNLHTGHRWRIKRSSENQGINPGQNVQFQTSGRIGAPPQQIALPPGESPPSGPGINNGPQIKMPPREIPDVPPIRYNGPVLEPAHQESAGRLRESPGLQRAIHNLHNSRLHTYTTRSPREIATPAFEFVVNDDNMGDTFRMNNDNDINLIHHVNSQGNGRVGGPPGARGRLQEKLNAENGGYRAHNNAGNGMEYDVDFPDTVAHDPSELQAAAEGAAIRAGDDIPHTRRRDMNRRRDYAQQQQQRQPLQNASNAHGRPMTAHHRRRPVPRPVY